MVWPKGMGSLAIPYPISISLQQQNGRLEAKGLHPALEIGWLRTDGRHPEVMAKVPGKQANLPSWYRDEPFRFPD